MRRLLTTTALAVGLALPAAAQNSDASDQSEAQMQVPSEQMETMGIMASNLIGHRLYIPRQNSAVGDSMQGGATQNSDMTSEDEAMETAEADMDTGVEGDVEQAANAAQNAAEEAGDAIATAAEQTGQAIESFGAEIAGEITDVPASWRMAGDIEDLVITEDGEVRALIVDAGGFLGVGETQRRVGLENVRFVTDSDDEGEFFVVYTGDRSTFEEEGAFDEAAARGRGEMRALQEPEIRSQLAERGYGPDAEAQAESASWGDFTTEELLGSAVYGENDEWIGDLSELALADDGNIEAVIIDVGGFLGIGEKPVRLSLNEVELEDWPTGIRAYVSATEEELETMETWDGMSQ